MKENQKKALNIGARYVIGLVFLFSSFVKGVDPLGTTYKIEDYLNVWSIWGIGFAWAVPLAQYMAMALIVLEFVVGVMLVFNGFKKLTPWVVALMMTFFTITTFIDARTNLVDDCGCFGDAVKLTNWQTFWKNVVLDVFVVLLFVSRSKTSKFRTERDVMIALFAIVIMVIFGVYNIKNEPCLDFRPWKIGNQMIPGLESEEELEVKSYLIYKNKVTGEMKQFESKDFMKFVADNPNYQEEWDFVDSRVENPYEIAADGFAMLDTENEDYATDLIGADDYLLIMTVHHIDEVDEDGVKAMKYMKRFASENNMQLVILSSAFPEQMQAFQYENALSDVDFYFADETAIKTMLRSNPGFILIRHGVVLGKWHYRNYLDINELELD